MNLKAVMVAGVVALLFIPLTGGTGVAGSEDKRSIEKPDMSGIIRKTAEDYKKDAALRATAHYLSAEAHRENHVLLSTIAVVVAGLVTLVTAISTTLGYTQPSPPPDPSRPAGLPPPAGSSRSAKGWLITGLVLAFISTGIASWQTQRNDGGDVAKHLASMVGYENLKRGLEVFLIKLCLNDFEEGDALPQLKPLMEQFRTIAQDSLILTPTAYAKATEQMRSIHQIVPGSAETDCRSAGAG